MPATSGFVCLLLCVFGTGVGCHTWTYNLGHLSSLHSLSPTSLACRPRLFPPPAGLCLTCLKEVVLAGGVGDAGNQSHMHTYAHTQVQAHSWCQSWLCNLAQRARFRRCVCQTAAEMNLRVKRAVRWGGEDLALTLLSSQMSGGMTRAGQCCW